MNKIIIENNKLLNQTANNTLEFTKNGEYILEINNSDKIDLSINVAENICIKLLIISLDNSIVSNIKYTLEEKSHLIVQKFYYNKQIKEEENIYLSGKYSKITYNFSTITSKEEYYKIRIYHNNNNVVSSLINKCVAFDNSKVTFDIDSILDKGNVGCDMNQDTKIINMGAVDAAIRPNMYIEEDDVVARHGSVIGKFSPDDIFYITSRGIPEKEAILLLIRGFILSNLIVDDSLSEKIIKIINNNYIG